jgi:hypothetical protein
MKIFFYWKSKTIDSERFQKVIDEFHFENDKMIFNTLDDLKSSLRTEMNSEIIVVIFTADKKDLSDVYSLRNFLHDFRLILVLPDLEESTISKGFECYPRFVSYINSDFNDVMSVLNKMSKKNISSTIK